MDLGLLGSVYGEFGVGSSSGWRRGCRISWHSESSLGRCTIRHDGMGWGDHGLYFSVR